MTSSTCETSYMVKLFHKMKKSENYHAGEIKSFHKFTTADMIIRIISVILLFTAVSDDNTIVTYGFSLTHASPSVKSN